MQGGTIEADVRLATEIARKVSDNLYGYYLTLRGPSMGAMPPDSIGSVTFKFRSFHEKVCANVWGWVCYARPLTQKEIDDYELVPDEHNHAVHRLWGVEVKKMIRDADGKRITVELAKDEDGKKLVTPYKGIAQRIADDLNDAALDTNSKDSITRASVIEVSVGQG